MAPELFVDTSGWFPLADSADAAHARVAGEMVSAVEGGLRIVTTNLVIAETYALLLRRVHRAAALAFLREATREPLEVVHSSADLEARARRDWLERYGDQDFSLTDAVSFAVMAERGIREALALDRHFAAAGFALRPPG